MSHHGALAPHPGALAPHPGALAPLDGTTGPSRRAAVATGLVLWLLYAGTASARLQPWDAAEFAAAFATFGVPHPPGTPLVVALGRAMVALATPWLSVPFAGALASATSGAVAGALLAWLLARRGISAAVATALAVFANAASTVWMSAIEPEAYAPALALGVAMLAAANEAALADARGATGTAWRWRVAVAYAVALAPAVHQLAWVAAPAAAWLGWPRAWRGWPSAGPGPRGPSTTPRGVVPWRHLALAIGLGLSAWGIVVGRARAGAPVLMGDPATATGLWDLATRAAYDGSGWWPRQASLAWQVVMPLQYLHDAYTAGLAHWPAWVVARFGVTLLLVLPAALLGWRWWRRHDAAMATAIGVLFVAGTLGVAWHLNLKLGATLGWGLVPDATPREVRERDTFFAVGVLAWGLLVGGGLVAVARQRGAAVLGAVGAWLAATQPSFDRERAPFTDFYAEGLAQVLTEAPPAGIVLAATDWDAFGLWYAQVAEGRRRDLTIVILGLLAEPGYRARLDAAWPGLVPPRGLPERDAVRHVQAWAVRRRRAVVVGPWSVAPVTKVLGAGSADAKALVRLDPGRPRTTGPTADR